MIHELVIRMINKKFGLYIVCYVVKNHPRYSSVNSSTFHKKGGPRKKRYTFFVVVVCSIEVYLNT